MPSARGVFIEFCDILLNIPLFPPFLRGTFDARFINRTQVNTQITMEQKKRKLLEEKGYRVGSAADFLELTAEEEAYIDIRLDIRNLVKAQRAKKEWTQEQLARSIGSSQSRIAKLEGGDPGISMDLMIKALLQLGISKEQIGKLLEGDFELA